MSEEQLEGKNDTTEDFLADNDEYPRILAKELYMPLLGRPYELAEATSGVEAEAALNAGGIDFALMDVNMSPGKTGLELAVMPRALPQGPKMSEFSTSPHRDASDAWRRQQPPPL